ncbi:MAG: hypothetical protein ACRDGD_01620 [Candidatus Limnocylindria bacterium]
MLVPPGNVIAYGRLCADPYEIGEDSIVILGPPFTFDESNIDGFNF